MKKYYYSGGWLFWLMLLPVSPSPCATWPTWLPLKSLTTRKRMSYWQNLLQRSMRCRSRRSLSTEIVEANDGTMNDEGKTHPRSVNEKKFITLFSLEARLGHFTFLNKLTSLSSIHEFTFLYKSSPSSHNVISDNINTRCICYEKKIWSVL